MRPAVRFSNLQVDLVPEPYTWYPNHNPTHGAPGPAAATAYLALLSGRAGAGQCLAAGCAACVCGA